MPYLQIFWFVCGLQQPFFLPRSFIEVLNLQKMGWWPPIKGFTKDFFNWSNRGEVIRARNMYKAPRHNKRDNMLRKTLKKVKYQYSAIGWLCQVLEFKLGNSNFWCTFFVYCHSSQETYMFSLVFQWRFQSELDFFFFFFW